MQEAETAGGLAHVSEEHLNDLLCLHVPDVDILVLRPTHLHKLPVIEPKHTAYHLMHPPHPKLPRTPHTH